MANSRFVVGVYMTEQNASYLKLITTGNRIHFLSDTIEPKTHVWSKYQNYWFAFHVFGIYGELIIYFTISVKLFYCQKYLFFDCRKYVF